MGYMCLGFPATDYESACTTAQQLVEDRLGHDFIKRAKLNGRAYHWQPCFAHCAWSDYKPSAYTILFNITHDYKTEFIDSPEFTERVNKWIKVGKQLGLKFSGLKWKLIESTNRDFYRQVINDQYNMLAGEAPCKVLMFYLPMKDINRVKILHLHLFFLRYLYERHATIDRYFELRSLFVNEFPWISRFGTLLLAEQSSHLATYKGTKPYASFVHHFLNNKSLECVILTANKRSMFSMAKTVQYFDTELGGPHKQPTENWLGLGYKFELDNDVSQWQTQEKFLETIKKLDKLYKEKVKQDE